MPIKVQELYRPQNRLERNKLQTKLIKRNGDEQYIHIKEKQHFSS